MGIPGGRGQTGMEMYEVREVTRGSRLVSKGQTLWAACMLFRAGFYHSLKPQRPPGDRWQSPFFSLTPGRAQNSLFKLGHF